MSTFLGEILGVPDIGTQFRYKSLPQTTFTVLETEVLPDETIIGYHLQEEGPRVKNDFYGKVWMGAGSVETSDLKPEDVEILKPDPVYFPKKESSKKIVIVTE